MEIRTSSDLQTHGKRLIFADEAVACRFHHYVELLSETGKVVKAAFELIDFRRTGVISFVDLRRALGRWDLSAEDAELQRMLALGSAPAGFDYSDFFHVLEQAFVAGPRDCLSEWRARAQPWSEPQGPSLLPGEVVALRMEERVQWTVFMGQPRPGPMLVHIY